MKRRLIQFCILIMIVQLLIPVSAFAFDDEWTLYNTIPYTSAKYEPSEGAYLGAYVLQEVSINNDMTLFNQMVGKKHVTYFKYLGYGKPFPIDWVNSIIELGGIPHIAWEPNNGLDSVQDDDYLRQFAQDAGAVDWPLFIRFASEMNGTWCAYSGDSTAYIEKWRLVHDVMEQEAPKAMMLWTVFTFPEEQIEKYYPGDEYVDWVGVNLYNVVYHNNNRYLGAMEEDPLRLLDFVYDTYSARKPIHITEYGVTHYTTTDDTYYIDFAKEKLSRIYGNLLTRYPRVKAITYFNVNNVDADNGVWANRRINNYALTTEDELIRTYADLIKDEKYLSEIEETPEPTLETLSFNYRYFTHQSKLYVDLDFYTNNLGLKIVEQDATSVTLSDGTTSTTVPIVRSYKKRTFYNRYYTIQGVPLRRVADSFGYNILIDYQQKSILLK